MPSPAIKNPADQPRHLVEIDGLRAIAVLSVIAFHMAPETFPGGMVGVDVFFVISGFVITRSALAHSEEGPRDFVLRFWLRRINRIYPALIVALLVGFLLSAVIVSSRLPEEIVKTGIYASIGASNLYLLAHAGNYFGLDSSLNPFVHTWSLGIEQQFYLLFAPLLAAIISVRADARLPLVIIAFSLVVAASLGAIAFGFDNYYSPVSRFFELFAGVTLVFLVNSGLWRSRYIAVWQIAGLAVLAFSPFLISGTAHYPWSQAIPAIFATAVLLASFSQQTASATAVLRLAPLVYVGKISYSLYLWHWIVISLGNYIAPESGAVVLTTEILLIIFLSALSYHFIERGRWSRHRHFLAITAATVILLLVARNYIASALSSLYAGHAFSAAELGTTDPKALWNNPQWVQDDCYHKDFDEACLPNSPLPTVFIVGDSHAHFFTPMFGRLADQAKVNLFFVPSGFEAGSLHEILPWILDHTKPGDILFFANRLSRSMADRPPISNLGVAQLGKIDFEHRKILRAALGKSLDAAAATLKSKEITLVLAAPLPELRFSARQCDFSMGVDIHLCSPISVQEEEDLRSAPLNVLRMVEKNFSNVIVWDSLPLICPDGECSASNAGMPTFLDDNHISFAMSRALAPDFEAKVLHQLKVQIN